MDLPQRAGRTVILAPMASDFPPGNLAATVSQCRRLPPSLRSSFGELVQVHHQQVHVAVVVDNRPQAAPRPTYFSRKYSPDCLATSTKCPAPSLRHQHGLFGIFVMGVAVGDEHVEVAVVVVVEQQAAPAGVLPADDGQPRRRGAVLEELAAVQQQAAVVHVGNVEVQPAVAVDVADGRAHRGNALAAFAERQPSPEGVLLELALAEVPEVSSSPWRRW